MQKPLGLMRLKLGSQGWGRVLFGDAGGSSDLLRENLGVHGCDSRTFVSMMNLYLDSGPFRDNRGYVTRRYKNRGWNGRVYIYLMIITITMKNY